MHGPESLLAQARSLIDKHRIDGLENFKVKSNSILLVYPAHACSPEISKTRKLDVRHAHGVCEVVYNYKHSVLSLFYY